MAHELWVLVGSEGKKKIVIAVLNVTMCLHCDGGGGENDGDGGLLAWFAYGCCLSTSLKGTLH